MENRKTNGYRFLERFECKSVSKAKQSQRCRLGDCPQRVGINMSEMYCRQLEHTVVSASPRGFVSRLPSGDVCTGQTNQREDHKLPALLLSVLLAVYLFKLNEIIIKGSFRVFFQCYRSGYSF